MANVIPITNEILIERYAKVIACQTSRHDNAIPEQTDVDIARRVVEFAESLIRD